MRRTGDLLYFAKVKGPTFSIGAVVFFTNFLDFLLKSVANKLPNNFFGDVPTNVFPIVT